MKKPKRAPPITIATTVTMPPSSKLENKVPPPCGEAVLLDLVVVEELPCWVAVLVEVEVEFEEVVVDSFWEAHTITLMVLASFEPLIISR